MCKEDVDFEIWWLVLVENRWQLPRILLDRSTIARISRVMAGTRRDLGSYRLGLVEDL
jgi:hypothetical protein